MMQALHIRTEADRQQFIQNIPKWRLISSTNPKASSDGHYMTRNITVWADLEQFDEQYIHEKLEQAILSAHLPSDGLDPQVLEMHYYFPFFDQPNRIILFAWIASEVF
jgi:hypothetical protein